MTTSHPAAGESWTCMSIRRRTAMAESMVSYEVWVGGRLGDTICSAFPGLASPGVRRRHGPVGCGCRPGSPVRRARPARGAWPRADRSPALAAGLTTGGGNSSANSPGNRCTSYTPPAQRSANAIRSVAACLGGSVRPAGELACSGRTLTSLLPSLTSLYLPRAGRASHPPRRGRRTCWPLPGSASRLGPAPCR